MKIAVMVGTFPALSETFVVDQICALIDAGVDVEIISIHRGQGTTRKIEHYRLLERLTVLCPSPRAMPRLRPLVFASSILGGLLDPRRCRVTWNSLCQFGKGSPGLSVLLRTAAVANFGPPRQFHAVIAHFGQLGVIAAQLRHLGLLRAPVATIFHGADISMAIGDPRRYRPYLWLFQQRCPLWPISNYWAAQLQQWGAARDDIQVMRMGVNPDVYQFHGPRQPPGQPLQLVSVARLVEKKGIADVIAAVAELKQRGIAVNYQIIGDGPLRFNLQQQATTLGVDDRVVFRGAVDPAEARRAVSDADLFVLPSVTATNGDMEGIPVSLMEAMAVGTIALSTRHSGIPELITDRVEGMLVDEHQPGQIADAIAEILAGRLDLQAIRNNARRKIESVFNQSQLNAQLLAALAALDQDDR